MLIILAAILGFITIAGLGFVFAGGSGGGASAKTMKRAQTIVSGTAPGARAKARAAATNAPELRRKQLMKSLKDQEREQKRQSASLQAKLLQAGLGLTVQHFWIASGVLAAVVFIPVLILGPNPIVAIVAAFGAGLGLPRWIVGFLAKRRMHKFTESFSDAIDIIVRGIKSGLPVHDCLKIIGKECPEPLAGEFRRLVENIGVGMTVEQSLEKMFERMPTSELRFFTIVLAIQAKTGGNLAEALNNLSQVLRARKLMREKIKALSSEAIASSFIIGSLPPGVVTLITVTTPSYMMVMFTTPKGNMFLLGAAIWMTFGILVMRKMINFKF